MEIQTKKQKEKDLGRRDPSEVNEKILKDKIKNFIIMGSKEKLKEKF